MRRAGRWKKKEQAKMLIQLGECLRDGYSLRKALNLLQIEWTGIMRRKTDQMILQLEKGVPFHDVLLFAGFPREIATTVYFSQRSGRLSRGLIESGTLVLRREEYKEKMGRLMRYPIILIWCLSMILLIISRFVLPSFLRLYQSFSIELPQIMKMLILLSGRSETIFAAGLLSALILLCAYLTFKRLPIGKKINCLIPFPFIGYFVRSYLTQQMCFQLGHLLSAGLSIRDSVASMTEKGTTSFLEHEAKRMGRLLEEGIELDKALETAGYYLSDFSSVVRHGERNGFLDHALQRYGMTVMKRSDQKIQTLMSCIQPVLLLLIGGFILGLFASVLIPVFEIINGL
ncbi:competence type IV pilus assembly protein ComGB [Sporolactobacillus sp. THM19-2]|uniref:competence type IV pilus assembly protein ComGB n=1 Tax=Sporolactobacillus sp. THM19-2 TaxID=2511171 RepID=UPI00102184B1|nr:competence type IV pilus assembly protein ComGB [Sporolactobacillus sp. THM19-2]RYL87828.1 type II secretion system F family protein [Sporolactobacillus sp. THM19-2]